ncbi:MAG TPA: hypothetical protein PLD54_00280 [Candidatus Levybacteria bacterium]|nr:hypothetical protein [Candidatus Levybacteria bacterium]
MNKNKIHSTTQGFTEVQDIRDGVLFLKGNNAASILEVSSVNFYLLSTDEQNARVYGFMSFLNSLSFAIQIFVVSKKVDMTDYLSMLETKIQNATNPRFSEHLVMYKQFIQELVKGEDLLNKKIYVVLPFSSLELGAVGSTNKKQSLQDRMRDGLVSKQNGIIGQIQRMGLSARQLESSEVAKVLYELYNQETVSLDFQSGDVKNLIL